MSVHLFKKLPAAGIALISILALAFLAGTTSFAGPYNPCEKPGQVAFNCGFDTFTEQPWGGKFMRVPTGWWYFVQSGVPDFRQSDDTYWGSPSLWMMSDGVGWNAGIYQELNVTPGQVYLADIGWSAPRCNALCADPCDRFCYDMERKIGLDPTGGTNPGAPSVIWGPAVPGPDKWPDLTVSARATGAKMTVFLMVNHPSSHGVDEIYLDALGVWPDTSQPIITNTPAATSTPTRRPPTRTPKPVALQPTDTPAPSETPLPTDTPTITPTNTATPTATPTATHTATPTPTWTPTPLPVRVAGQLDSARLRTVSRLDTGAARRAGPERWLLVAAGTAVVAAVLVGLLVLVLWLRGAGSKRA
jgi:hypothetical protein